jgi:ribosomal protein S18 acetylase RimI-like enzyme
MAYIVREAERGDFHKIYPLFKQLWPNDKLDEQALRTVFLSAVSSETDVLLCAERDGDAVGFCAYAVMRNLWQPGRIAYVYAMVVDEKARGNGVGTTLMETVLEDARRRGIVRVELDSAFHREQAHRFYEKLGFDKRAYLFSYYL